MSSKTLPGAGRLEPSDHSWSVKMDCCVRPQRQDRTSARNTRPTGPTPAHCRGICTLHEPGSCQARGPGISAGPGHLLPWPQLSPTCGVGDRPWGSPLHSSDEQGLLQGSDSVLGSNALIMRVIVRFRQLATHPLIVSECPGALEMAVQDGN